MNPNRSKIRDRRQPTRLPHPWDSPGRNTGMVAISFSNAWKWKVKVKLVNRVRLFATPWTAAYQAPPPVGFSRQEYWSGVLLPSPNDCLVPFKLGVEEKGTSEDEMAGWHHRLDGCESEWTPGVGDGQGGLACCDSWGRKELDTTEWLNWTEPFKLSNCYFKTTIIKEKLKYGPKKLEGRM